MLGGGLSHECFFGGLTCGFTQTFCILESKCNRGRNSLGICWILWTTTKASDRPTFTGWLTELICDTSMGIWNRKRGKSITIILKTVLSRLTPGFAGHGYLRFRRSDHGLKLSMENVSWQNLQHELINWFLDLHCSVSYIWICSLARHHCCNTCCTIVRGDTISTQHHSLIFYNTRLRLFYDLIQ